MAETKFVIVSFDGLRPDLIDEQQTPNLFRLKKHGTTLASQRTIYPSETRTAFPSLVTAGTAAVHGMVGNKFVDRGASPQRYIDTADAVLLDRLDRESGGRLMTAPTLGELLARAGKSLAVLATNTPGTTRLFHHKAEMFGHVRLSGHFPEACTPKSVLDDAVARFGPLPPVPPAGEPDIDAQTLITTVFLEYLWPERAPDVTVISYGEPDTCSHLNGTGAAATRKVIRHCDAEFGRILDWWEAEGRANGVQIIALSDHGHITAHTRVSVAACLSEAGFHPGTAPVSGVDVVVVPGQVGALYLADRGRKQLARLVGALTEFPWVGPVFTAPGDEVEGVVSGTFASSLVLANHERAPDVYFAFRADDRRDRFGLVGGTFYDSSRSPGLGVHGGLHPKELASVGIVAGTAFLSGGHVSKVPSGICDVVPTILAALDMRPVSGMTGRVLSEVFATRGAFAPPPVSSTEVFETRSGNCLQRVQRTRVEATVYIDGGWVEATEIAAETTEVA
ncbi:alkaline phosphatase family protein [Mesorhizobium sp. NPDC059054]|uniref:alkaline phosphatase family protein n=1 Tax=Mesorhizobium sp. NPDC059054 TaxID=3346711 RepID=UPI003687D5A5